MKPVFNLATLTAGLAALAGLDTCAAQSTGNLQTSKSSSCLQIDSLSNGAHVSTAACANAAAQTWQFRPSVSRTNTVLRSANNLCLDLPDGKIVNGAKVQVWTCNTSNPNQFWNRVGNNIRFRSTAFCLDVADGAASGFAPGHKVQIWECNYTSTNQKLSGPGTVSFATSIAKTSTSASAKTTTKTSTKTTSTSTRSPSTSSSSHKTTTTAKSSTSKSTSSSTVLRTTTTPSSSSSSSTSKSTTSTKTTATSTTPRSTTSTASSTSSRSTATSTSTRSTTTSPSATRTPSSTSSTTTTRSTSSSSTTTRAASTSTSSTSTTSTTSTAPMPTTTIQKRALTSIFKPSAKRMLAWGIDDRLAPNISSGRMLSAYHHWELGKVRQMNSALTYIPTYWGHTKNDSWATVKAELGDEVPLAVAGFNEPDIASQANMDPNTAAESFYQDIDLYYGRRGANTIAPAVAWNIDGWLVPFMNRCAQLGCQIDAVGLHIYLDLNNNTDAAVAEVQRRVKLMYARTGKPIVVSELGLTAAGGGTDAQMLEFVQKAGAFLDSTSYVLGWALSAVFAYGNGWDTYLNSELAFFNNNGTLRDLAVTYMQDSFT